MKIEVYFPEVELKKLATTIAAEIVRLTKPEKITEPDTPKPKPETITPQFESAAEPEPTFKESIQKISEQVDQLAEPEAEPEPTFEDVRQALRRVSKSLGREGVLKVLEKVGYSKAPDIPPEKFRDVLEIAREVLH